MSLKAKIEAVIYASEEPVTLLQLAGLLGQEAQAELDAEAADQAQLALGTDDGDAGVAIVAEQGGEMAVEHETVADDEPAAETLATVAGDDLGAGDVASREMERERRQQRERERGVREHLQRAAAGLIRDYAESDRGIEIREVAGGYRMGTKPEYHDAVRGFVKNLKPALKLTLQALETLAVVAYKQPVTAAEISEIRGVDSAGVLGGLMTRKLIATAGRKQVIGRPMLYRTTKDFLVRFGLKDVHELPSMEEFEKMAGELNEQEDLPIEDAGQIVERANARGDAEHIREANEGGGGMDDTAASIGAEAATPEGAESTRDNEA